MRKVAVLLLALLLLFPIYFMVQGSFQSISWMLAIPPKFFPANPSLDNYAVFGEIVYLWRWVVNSAIIVVLYSAGGVIVNGLAGYAFSFARFRGKQIIFWLFLATLLVSRAVLLIPQYVVVRGVGLQGMTAVVLMYTFAAGYIYLFRNYFESIPSSLLESAEIDGAGDWRKFWRIVLPLSKPVVAAVIVMRGIEGLSDFIWQVINLTHENEKTMLVGFTQSINRVAKWSKGLAGRDVGFELAVGVVLVFPIMLLFAFASRYFIKGVTLGGVKE